MSTKELYEQIAEKHAELSNAYLELAAELGDSDEAPKGKKPAKGKPAAADEDEDEDDVPPAKAAGTTGKKRVPAKKTPVKPAADADDDADEDDDEPAKPVAKGKKPAKEAAEEEYTEADVIEAAQALIKAVNKEAAVKIIKKHGGAKVADLDEDVYPKVIKALKAAMPSDDEDEDDDGDI